MKMRDTVTVQKASLSRERLDAPLYVASNMVYFREKSLGRDVMIDGTQIVGESDGLYEVLVAYHTTGNR